MCPPSPRLCPQLSRWLCRDFGCGWSGPMSVPMPSACPGILSGCGSIAFLNWQINSFRLSFPRCSVVQKSVAWGSTGKSGVWQQSRQRAKGRGRVSANAIPGHNQHHQLPQSGRCLPMSTLPSSSCPLRFDLWPFPRGSHPSVDGFRFCQ